MTGGEPVRNPADHRDQVGTMRVASEAEMTGIMSTAANAVSAWRATSVETRAAALRSAADAMENAMPVLIGLIVREAGKSFANAIAEVREAVDFLRYYASEAVRTLAGQHYQSLGPVVCISPWNFPLAIFTGQIAAALVAGNTVLAKPAEETPLIAAEAVRILHAAGIPLAVLQLVPGAGHVGAALVADTRTMGVMFTGSTAVARLIQSQLAQRIGINGQPIPLIAETGGQNAMVVDSSALAEQVVGDVIASAFDSAGQRCSALRILCLQEDIAGHTLAMLKGAMRELDIGNPDKLSTDVGPVISAEARDGIMQHIAAMASRGFSVLQMPLGPAAEDGTFVPPTLIEIKRIADVEREVFGPVLHVLRFARKDLDELIGDINATGYGLTFGLHTRIDETISRVVSRAVAGNIYVNRNIIGATVGVQPFGGSGLSGTGPKAGGPLYLGRLLQRAPHNAVLARDPSAAVLAPARLYTDWLKTMGHDAEAECVVGYMARSVLGASIELSGPVGERNVYILKPRGHIAALASAKNEILVQMGAILATGNTAVVESGNPVAILLDKLPPALTNHIARVEKIGPALGLHAVLTDAEGNTLIKLNQALAEWDGPIVAVQSVSPSSRAIGADYDLKRLLEEVAIATNTAAAGGNASLMSIG